MTDLRPEDVLDPSYIEEVLNALAVQDQQITLHNIAKRHLLAGMREQLMKDGLSKSEARAVVEQVKARRANGKAQQARKIERALSPFPEPFNPDAQRAPRTARARASFHGTEH